MTYYEIYKRCSKCGLQYWEDGRVSEHSCQQPEIKVLNEGVFRDRDENLNLIEKEKPKDDGLNYLREANKPKPKEPPQEPKDKKPTVAVLYPCGRDKIRKAKGLDK